MTIAFISHADCALHETTSYHPDTAERLAAIHDRLIASGLEMVMHFYDAPMVTLQQLFRVHDADYVSDIFQKLQENERVWLDADTLMVSASLTAAQRGAGAVVKAVDLVMSQDANTAFCCVRPPGHHAEHNKAMGFCIFNNVAVGVAHAIAEYGLQRVAIIDFDAHHGNGTEDIFRGNQQILLCSSFQHPFYPDTGEPGKHDNMINIGLPAGTSGEQFRQLIEEQWLPELEAFQPEMIFISAGFDGHREDDMSDLDLVEDDFAWVTSEVKKIADKFAQGRIVSTLEGGYVMSALGRSVASHIDALL
ncbi:Deacetylase, including acetoin utilization protein [Methylophaga aminisulfidivorans MP]|uniref:Deacetylase, including acetoin utilization protein n=1 Tax=Methylophaga aminisulfidivorans MP TaxID=1026882 RepID=F5SZ56_9GAMM|nr:histone deacetylase family protein [Methylophaga aminisulfidivorans]EGL54579.1 Deacetylase, including acetoin utilization protein [Methylophaga aminisulfidivorans MP]